MPAYLITPIRVTVEASQGTVSEALSAIDAIKEVHPDAIITIRVDCAGVTPPAARQ